MSQARINKRAKIKANKKHDPALRKLMVQIIAYLNMAKDSIEQTQDVLDRQHIRWLRYCGKHNDANRDAFMDNLFVIYKKN